MLVKFTNLVQGREDDPLYINPDHIIAVYEDRTDHGSLVTRIYGGTEGSTWTVQESLGQVVKILEKHKNGL